MAAKNLDEAIQKAMCLSEASEFPRILKGELQDYLAHEVMRVLGTKPTADQTKILHDFFRKIFVG